MESATTGEGTGPRRQGWTTEARAIGGCSNWMATSPGRRCPDGRRCCMTSDAAWWEGAANYSSPRRITTTTTMISTSAGESARGGGSTQAPPPPDRLRTPWAEAVRPLTLRYDFRSSFQHHRLFPPRRSSMRRPNLAGTNLRSVDEMKYVTCTTGDAMRGKLRALQQGNARECIAFDLIMSNIKSFFGRHHHPIRTHHFNKKQI